MPTNKISDYKKRSIISMARDGISHWEISSELGVSKSTISRIMIADGKEVDGA